MKRIYKEIDTYFQPYYLINMYQSNDNSKHIIVRLNYLSQMIDPAKLFY